MTNEEAINNLKHGKCIPYKHETLTMAIKALETVSCIKEKCAYCPHCENCDVDDETLEIKPLEQKEKIVHCKDCKYRDYWGSCKKWDKELDAHKTFLLDENMFCGFAEIEDGE